ncbi:MAG: 2Fe-2S iron-sulfur cluster-binding protein [[Clostridium] scindens]
MIEITINGKACTCEKGEFLLEVARRNGFYIPTLCHHPGVAEQGCCRVCLVEVVENKRSKIVVSCVYPVERPCEVYTDSARVREDRGAVLMLLAARARKARRSNSCASSMEPWMAAVLPR